MTGLWQDCHRTPKVTKLASVSRVCSVDEAEGHHHRGGLALCFYGRTGHSYMRYGRGIAEGRVGRDRRRTFWCAVCQPSRAG